eukprot:12414644-Karenia_brevis.AAC.2
MSAVAAVTSIGDPDVNYHMRTRFTDDQWEYLTQSQKNRCPGNGVELCVFEITGQATRPRCKAISHATSAIHRLGAPPWNSMGRIHQK